MPFFQSVCVSHVCPADIPRGYVRTRSASAQNLPNPLPEILMLMKANPRITYAELAVRLCMSRESMRKHIKSLKERHKLITRQGGTRGFWVTHSNPGE